MRITMIFVLIIFYAVALVVYTLRVDVLRTIRYTKNK